MLQSSYLVVSACDCFVVVVSLFFLAKAVKKAEGFILWGADKPVFREAYL